MFYPVQYEGEESSKNVFYTGAAPNQQAIPATDYFLNDLGVQKFALLGTDFLPASKKLKSDWKNLGCGKYDTTSNTCVQIKSDY